MASTPVVVDDSVSTDKYYPDVEFKCWSCGEYSYHLKVCSLCQCAKYCNRECQAKHWSEHKRACQRDIFTPSEYHKGGCFVEVNQESVEDDNLEVYFIGLDKCVKNGHNNHSGFIDIEDVRIEDLPKPIQHQPVLEFIKAEAQTTVRVKVKYTSQKRPDSDTCAKHRGTRFVRTASAFYLLDNPDWFKTIPCPIPNCHRKKDLGPDHCIYEGDLKVFTNKHVVFDHEEVTKTTVDFFYNSNNKENVVQEYAIKLFYLRATSDKAFMKLTIHDEYMHKHLYDLDCARGDKYRAIPLPVMEKWTPYAILISHPHGMPKKISIGKITKIVEENLTEETRKNAIEAGDLQKKWYTTFQEEDYQKFMTYIGVKDMPVFKLWYDTPSCPGSSGGQVLFGGIEIEGVRGPFFANHNGYDLDTTLNFFKCIKLIIT